MDFAISLPIPINWKSKIYNSILVIINQLMKMVYYKPLKVIINTPVLAKFIITVKMQDYNFSDLIVSN